MLLFLSITGSVLSIILLSFNARNYRSSVYLGSFFFLISLYSFVQYVIVYSRSISLISIIYLNLAFMIYLIGPMLFWYVRSVLKDNARLKKADIIHLIPSIIVLATSLPYLFTSWAEKGRNAKEILDHVGYLGANKPTALFELVPNSWIYLSRPFLVLAYSLWSGWLVFRFIRVKNKLSVFSGQRYMIIWLIVLLGFLLILSTSQLIFIRELFISKDPRLLFTFNVLQMLSLTGLTGLLVSPFFFPGILYGMPQMPETAKKANDMTEEVYLSNELVKKKMPNFESEYLDFIRHKLESYMVEKQPYLDQDCNLAFISARTDIPAHHLSYYFREVKKQSFNEYRNELRIDFAKQLIREGKARELTLEGIGLQSGFSTRNTFFTVFKKVTGETPSAYNARFLI
jgi:AraC-like DNA-binding protein